MRALSNSLLAHPKVGDLDVPLLVQHDIVQLQVPGINFLLTMLLVMAKWILACKSPRGSEGT